MNEKRNPQLEELIIHIFTPIKITTYAVEKANCIAKCMCDLAGKPLEIGFYLLNNDLTEKDITIRDVYIAHDQLVYPAYCDIQAIGNIKTMRDVRDNLKKRIIGWGHSHAEMGVFYSGIDDKTIIDRTKSWGVERKLLFRKNITNDPAVNLKYVSDNNTKGIEFVIGGKKIFLSAGLFYEHLDEHNRKSMSIYVEDVQTVSIFYGMTFNALGSSPFCVVGYASETDAAFIENVKFKLIEEKGIINKQEIEQQLIERVINVNLRKRNESKKECCGENGEEGEKESKKENSEKEDNKKEKEVKKYQEVSLKINSFENFKIIYQDCQKINNYLFESSWKDVEEELSIVESLNKNLDSIDRMILDTEMDNGENYSKMLSLQNELFRKMKEHKEKYIKKKEEVSIQIIELPITKMFQKNKLKKLEKQYERIIKQLYG